MLIRGQLVCCLKMTDLRTNSCLQFQLPTRASTLEAFHEITTTSFGDVALSKILDAQVDEKDGRTDGRTAVTLKRKHLFSKLENLKC